MNIENLDDLGNMTLTFRGHCLHWSIGLAICDLQDHDLDLFGARDVISHVTVGLAMCDFLYVVNGKHTSKLHGYGDIKRQILDTCKWQSINGRASAHTTSDRTGQKIFLCVVRGAQNF